MSPGGYMSRLDASKHKQWEVYRIQCWFHLNKSAEDGMLKIYRRTLDFNEKLNGFSFANPQINA